MKKNIVLIIIIIIVLFFSQNVQAEQIDGGFNSYVEELAKYSSESQFDIDLSKIADNLKNGKGLFTEGMLGIILKAFFKEISSVMASSIIILIIILISSIISSLQISKDSSVIKLTNFLCYISLSIAAVSSFITMLDLFKNTCSDASNIMQVISPFLLGMLIVNGAITSVGIIKPLILFVSNFSSFLVINIITPMLVLSIVFAVIGNLNEKNSLFKIGSFLRKTSIWVLGIMLTVFLGVLSMETSISKDVDSLAVKTTTAAVSNFVPVVGKFFSDSMSSVVGASKIITKVGGTLGIVTVIILSLGPIIKMIGAWLSYQLISIFTELLDSDKRISKIISELAEVYKTMSGIIIANSLVFIISIAIMLSLSSSIVN